MANDEYREWIASIKEKIKSSQIKASMKVNKEFLELYWYIGEDIVNHQRYNVVAEYSLEEVSQPIGIAGYELRNALRKEYQSSLPTIEALESEVAKMVGTK